ncbi:MAG TPA: glycosyltransferase family 39 protein, partial [Geobacteraceae bacterium]|nr:glycosyltransferase family 39 protein [Geobacteraceae bacterium]
MVKGDEGRTSPVSVEQQTLPTSLLIVAICIAVYAKCLFYGITQSDDEVLITGSLPYLQNFANILKVFTTDAFYQVKSIDLYRPLQSATFIIDAQWGGDTVFAAHCTNLLLHILSCLAVFRLFVLLQLRRRIALLGALVYATHYLFMTAVVWLPARGDLLLALFTFLTLITFIRQLETGKRRFYLYHALCFALAISSKESAVVLPLLLALYVWAYGKTSLFTGKKTAILSLYYAAVLTVYFLLKSAAVILYQGDTGFVPFLKNLRTLPEMVARFYLPVNMSTLPEYKLSATLTGLLLLAGLTALLWQARDRVGREVLFAAAWFLLCILPGMAYFPVFYYFAYEHVDHRAYVTCFGLLLLNLHLVQAYGSDQQRYFRIATTGLLLYLALFNLYYSGNYKDPAAFALRAIRTNPHSAKAFATYGTELHLLGRDDEALENLDRAIGIFRRYMPALHTRAEIYRSRGLNREALADLDALLAADPEYDPNDYYWRGLLKVELGDY